MINNISGLEKMVEEYNEVCKIFEREKHRNGKADYGEMLYKNFIINGKATELEAYDLAETFEGISGKGLFQYRVIVIRNKVDFKNKEAYFTNIFPRGENYSNNAEVRMFYSESGVRALNEEYNNVFGGFYGRMSKSECFKDFELPDVTGINYEQLFKG